MKLKKLILIACCLVQLNSIIANELVEEHCIDVEFTTVIDGNVSRATRHYPTRFLIDHNGHLTEESVKHFLVSALEQKQLPAFSDTECLNVKNIMNDKGAFTDQLFVIESSCDGCFSLECETQQFILKGVVQANEINKLNTASTYAPLLPVIYPNRQANLPQLNFPFYFLSYEYGGKRHRLSLMYKAPGQSILTYLRQFLRDPGNRHIHDTIVQCYIDVGRAMANFYKKYTAHARSKSLPHGIIHGDFHVGNIFYDQKTRQVTLIDNASMAHSIREPGDCRNDIAVLLVGLLHLLPEHVRGKWRDITIPNFCTGFLSTYPPAEQSGISKELQKCVKRSRTYLMGNLEALERLAELLEQ